MNFNSMSGLDFEKLVYQIFSKLGFRTQMTRASGDGGIDLIAHFDGLIFKGKYLIQCKRWKANVGEPEVRDLYGTTISEQALKGILITTSAFTKQAIEFARGKNIELIDCSGLLQLMTSTSIKVGLLPSGSAFINVPAGFLSHEAFDKDRYSLYDERIKLNPTADLPQKALIHYLMDAVLDMGYESIENGLVDECYARLETFKDSFCRGRKESVRFLRASIVYRQALLMFVKGRIGEAYELMVNEMSDYPAFNPSYTALQVAICVISESKPLMIKAIKPYDVHYNSGFGVPVPDFIRKIFTYTKNQLHLNDLPLFWISEGQKELSVGMLKDIFKIDFTGIEDQRKILLSYI